MRPEVAATYRDYVPPIDAPAVVTKLMRSVPASHFVGLGRIVVTNRSGRNRRERRQRVWSSNRKAHAADARGLYHPAFLGHSAHIELFVDGIIDGVPRVMLQISLVRDLLFAGTLYHELGHHVLINGRKEPGPREGAADDWSLAQTAAFIRAEHRYALPLFRVVGAFCAGRSWCASVLMRPARRRRQDGR